MDPETERALAALLTAEAARLKAAAAEEGVSAYLRKPAIRGRPNRQFLAATIRGVDQANRMGQVNEMWRLKEAEEQKERARRDRRHGAHSQHEERSRREDIGVSRRQHEYKEREPADSVESGLGNDELEAFLQKRVKRGRGSVGSRMDEPGPYLPPSAAEAPSSSQPGFMHDVRVPRGPELGPLARRLKELKKARGEDSNSEIEDSRNGGAQNGEGTERVRGKSTRSEGRDQSSESESDVSEDSRERRRKKKKKKRKEKRRKARDAERSSSSSDEKDEKSRKKRRRKRDRKEET